MDGVGSAPKGMAAAQAVSDALVEFFSDQCAEPELDLQLELLLQQTNTTICGWGLMDGTARPLGACAATVIWIDMTGNAHVFHAGDTTALHIRDGNYHALTAIHQNVDGHLLNYFGLPNLELQRTGQVLEEGDRILIFSDGIAKAFQTNQQIVDIVESRTTPNASLGSLMTAARAAGSTDDATVILMDFEPFEVEP